MSHRRFNKTRFSVTRLLLIAICMTGVIYGSWRYIETRRTLPAPHITYYTPVSAQPVPEGFDRFMFENQSFSIVYPRTENPITVKRGVKGNVITRLQSRHFEISLWPAEGFIFKAAPGQPVCSYDRALERFWAESGAPCSVKPVDHNNFFVSKTYENGTYRFTYLLPVKYHQYFLEVTRIHKSECGYRTNIYSAVCTVRANDEFERLKLFIEQLVKQNQRLVGTRLLE